MSFCRVPGGPTTIDSIRRLWVSRVFTTRKGRINIQDRNSPGYFYQTFENLDREEKRHSLGS